jgi:hypothetical protein
VAGNKNRRDKRHSMKKQKKMTNLANSVNSTTSKLHIHSGHPPSSGWQLDVAPLIEMDNLKCGKKRPYFC